MDLHIKKVWLPGAASCLLFFGFYWVLIWLPFDKTRFQFLAIPYLVLPFAGARSVIVGAPPEVAVGFLIVTFVKVAVVVAPVLWLVTASPTYTVDDIEIVSVPTISQFVPSLDS